jgi:membrane-associated phospholipid phosphatase
MVQSISIKKSLLIPFIALAANNASADGIRTFGDYMQVINPVVAAGFASQEKGLGHFAIIYAQNAIVVNGTKYIANKNKFSASRRPNKSNPKSKYDGMPSGHTNAAWMAASYIRTFHEDNPYLSIPFYATAAVTGYSRVHAKKHTTAQVITGAAIAEILTYINNKMDWSKNYQPTSFYIGGDEVSASFEIKF